MSEHPQSAAWIDGIDRDFLFGNTRPPLLVCGLTPSPLQLGTTQVNWGLALVYINYYIVYLGFVTTLGLFGERLVTLAPGVGQGGVHIPSLLVLQVSNDLAFQYIYSTDVGKVDYAYLGLFLAGIDPSLREGVKITKIAVAP